LFRTGFSGLAADEFCVMGGGRKARWLGRSAGTVPGYAQAEMRDRPSRKS